MLLAASVNQLSKNIWCHLNTYLAHIPFEWDPGISLKWIWTLFLLRFRHLQVYLRHPQMCLIDWRCSQRINSWEGKQAHWWVNCSERDKGQDWCTDPGRPRRQWLQESRESICKLFGFYATTTSKLTDWSGFINRDYILNILNILNIY